MQWKRSPWMRNHRFVCGWVCGCGWVGGGGVVTSMRLTSLCSATGMSMGTDDNGVQMTYE